MLDQNILEQLRGHFAKMTRPVRLIASYDDSATSRQMRELLTELASVSGLITVEEKSSERAPSFALSTETSEEAVRFAGLPLGHEFTSLVLAILQMGGNPPVASEQTLAQIAALNQPMVFETFFSQSCQNCPEVVQALNLMAILNPNIRHVAIDGASFRAEAEDRSVLAVPTVFMNGEPFGSGRMSLDEIVSRLDVGAATARASELDGRDPYDVLVVGAGPAGAAAAIYAARKGIRTALVAERVGGQVNDTMGIENLISVKHTEGPQLVSAIEGHVRDYAVDLIEREHAVRLSDADGLTTVELASGAHLKARSVIVATGARWRRMGVPGEEEYLNKGVTFCPHCDGPLFAGKRVAVIGGGNSGVEAAIDLAGVVSHVTLIEFDSVLRADEVLQRKLRSLANVDVITSAQTTEVTGDKVMNGLTYLDRVTGLEHHLDLEGVFVQIGLVPNTDWLKGALDLSLRGEVEIDMRGATSRPGVFAAGDCTTVPFKQIVIAMGAGATAALSAFDHLIRTSAPESETVSV